MLEWSLCLLTFWWARDDEHWAAVDTITTVYEARPMQNWSSFFPAWSCVWVCISTNGVLFYDFRFVSNGFGESCPFLRSSFSFTMPSQMFSYMSMPEGIYLSLIVTNSSMDWVEIPIWNASLKIIAGGESKLKAAQIEVFIKPHKNFHCGDTKKLRWLYRCRSHALSSWMVWYWRILKWWCLPRMCIEGVAREFFRGLFCDLTDPLDRKQHVCHQSGKGIVAFTFTPKNWGKCSYGYT